MSRKVLVIGNEMAGGKNIQQVLGKASYEVAHRGNVDEALTGFQDELPDLAIVNSAISHDEGVELCRALKSTEHGKKTPILLISGLDKAALHEMPEFDPNGYDQCLTRAVTEDRLVGICAYWLHPEPGKAAVEDPLDVNHGSDHVLDGGEVLDALDQLESIILESEAAGKKNGASEPDPVETEVSVEAMPESLNESLAELARLDTELSSMPPIEAATSNLDKPAPSTNAPAPMTPAADEITISMDDLCDASEVPEKAREVIAESKNEAKPEPVEAAPESPSDGGQDIEAHLDSLFNANNEEGSGEIESPVLLDSGSRPIELHSDSPLAAKDLEQTKLIDIEAGATREYADEDPEAYAAGYPEVPNEPIEEPVVASYEPPAPTRQSELVVNDAAPELAEPLPVEPIDPIESGSRTWLWIAAGVLVLGIAGWFMLRDTGTETPEPVAQTPRTFSATPTPEPTPIPTPVEPISSEPVALSQPVESAPVEVEPIPVAAVRPEPKPVAAAPVQRPEPAQRPTPVPATPEPVDTSPAVAVAEPIQAPDPTPVPVVEPVEPSPPPVQVEAEPVEVATNDAPPATPEPNFDPVPAEVVPEPVEVPQVVETGVETATRFDDPVTEPVVETPPAPTGFVAATVLKRVEPKMPAGSRKKAGTVVLRVQVTETGKIAKVVVEEGIKGASEFESAAIYAVLNWKYQPATEDGVPVSTWVNESFEFKP